MSLSSGVNQVSLINMVQSINPPQFELVDEHALLNSVVLGIVFDYCPRSVWKDVRLVCQTWNKELLPRWREHMVVRMTDISTDTKMTRAQHAKMARPQCDKRLKAKQLLWNYHSSTNLADPLNLDNLPFRTLSVRSPSRVEDCSVQNNFWEICGPWLKRLFLESVFIVDVNVLKRVLFEKTPNVEELSYKHCQTWTKLKVEKNDFNFTYKQPQTVQSKLKSLTIYMDMDASRPETCLPISWNNLFSHFPNLQKLVFGQRVNGATFDSNLMQVLCALQIVREATKNKTPNLTEFVLNYSTPNSEDSDLQPFTPALFAKLTELCLPLTSVFLFLDLDGDENENMARLLQSLKCLHTLRVDRFPIGHVGHPNESFPSKPYSINSKTIKRLELNGPIFPSWGFLSGVPNLTELDLDTWNETHLNVPKGVPSIILKDLTALKYTCDTPAPANMIQYLSSAMPNLRKLELTVDIDGIVAICQNWTGLEELSIVLMDLDVDNETLLGLLIAIKNLKSIKLTFEEHEQLFDTKSIYNGFLKMPHLTKLVAEFCPEVGAPALCALQKHVRDTRGCCVFYTRRQFPRFELDCSMDIDKYVASVQGTSELHTNIKTETT